jgi:HEAT repeat protein
VDKLVAALRHPDPTTPLRAPGVLGELRAREAVPTLMELAGSSPDPLLREAAVQALGRIGDPRSTHLLQRLAQSESVLVQRAATRALPGRK